MTSDQERAVELLLSHRGMLLGYITAIVRDADLAEDVLQNVAVVVLKKPAPVADERAFAAWARRVARLEALTALRQRRRAPELLDGAVLDLLEGHWAVTDGPAAPARKALRGCVERLTPHARQLIALRYAEGLPSKVVAERLGRPLNTVHVALSRTYKLLAECVRRSVARQGEGHE